MPLVVNSTTVKPPEIEQKTDRRMPEPARRSSQTETSQPPQTIRRVNRYRRSNRTMTAKQEGKPEVLVRVVSNPPAGVDAPQPDSQATAATSPAVNRLWGWTIAAAAWMGLLVLTLCVFSPR